MSLIDACGSGVCGFRDRAILSVMWRAGLRVSELLALQPRDIDRQNDGLTIRVRHGKGDKSRSVAMSVESSAWLVRWLDERAKTMTSIGYSPWIFCRVKRRGKKDAKPMTSSAVRKMLATLAKRAGIEKRVHPHGFRHTFALELDTEAQPLRIIQQALGHNKPSTTSVYLSALGGGEVSSALKARKI